MFLPTSAADCRPGADHVYANVSRRLQISINALQVLRQAKLFMQNESFVQLVITPARTLSAGDVFEMNLKQALTSGENCDDPVTQTLKTFDNRGRNYIQIQLGL